jgi:OmpA-OmpF porin, OOP family
MFEQSGRNILLGVLGGVLLSSVSLAAVAQDERKTYHLLDSKGQPVLDGKKECVDTPTPNTPAKLFELCGDILDSDGDGVPDDRDKCPGTPKGVKVDADGCPLDSDGDGVPDYRDKCPNNTPLEISKGVDADGCPLDSDGDGVPDYRDKCPGTPKGVKVDADGCGVVDRVVQEILGSDITFGFNRADLTPQGNATLDRIATEILSQIDFVKDIRVVGHTDSVGSDKYNQTLSERRAASVANYLISKGVPADKVIREGRGKRQPIATNATAAGRAQNRRVEIDISMYGAAN